MRKHTFHASRLHEQKKYLDFFFSVFLLDQWHTYLDHVNISILRNVKAVACRIEFHVVTITNVDIVGSGKRQALPDRTFHNFRASRSGHQRILCSSETPIPGFRGSKMVKCSVGYYMSGIELSHLSCRFETASVIQQTLLVRLNLSLGKFRKSRRSLRKFFFSLFENWKLVLHSYHWHNFQ